MRLAVAQSFTNLKFHTSHPNPHHPFPSINFSFTNPQNLIHYPKTRSPFTRKPTHKPVGAHKNGSSHRGEDDEEGIPIDMVKTLVRLKSRHNYIRVLEVSRRAGNPLSGSRLLLLDAPGNIHSISFLFKSLTNTYFDVFATLPPILPPGPLAILGFGAGSTARIILETYPQPVIHGWELDPAVISVGREYFGLSKMEKQYPDRLFIHIGDALKARAKNGFSGILVDLFSRGVVIPELQDPTTWEKMKGCLRAGGRVMANVGGSCVEPEDTRRDGEVIMEETLKAMSEVFPAEELHVLRIENREDDSSLALTGHFPDKNQWKKELPKPLRHYVDIWQPYDGW